MILKKITHVHAYMQILLKITFLAYMKNIDLCFQNCSFGAPIFTFFWEENICLSWNLSFRWKSGHVVCKKNLIISYFLDMLNDFIVQGGACTRGSCQYKVNNHFYFSLSVQHFGVVYMITNVTFFWKYCLFIAFLNYNCYYFYQSLIFLFVMMKHYIEYFPRLIFSWWK
jgi:hypothetical protein